MRAHRVAVYSGLLLVVMTIGMPWAPSIAVAQSRHSHASQHRQNMKNQWRNIGIASAAVGLFGLVKHDNTLVFAGAAGALYSANRYEQDRKSQNKSRRARAEMFRRRSFDRNGHHYVRRTVKKHGHTYYQYVRK